MKENLSLRREEVIKVILGEPTEEQLTELSKQANKYMKIVKENALSELKNDKQREIFLDWWSGGRLWKNGSNERADKYKDVNKEDWTKAHDLILWACGQGCG